MLTGPGYIEKAPKAEKHAAGRWAGMGGGTQNEEGLISLRLYTCTPALLSPSFAEENYFGRCEPDTCNQHSSTNMNKDGKEM